MTLTSTKDHCIKNTGFLASTCFILASLYGFRDEHKEGQSEASSEDHEPSRDVREPEGVGLGDPLARVPREELVAEVFGDEAADEAGLEAVLEQGLDSVGPWLAPLRITNYANRTTL